MSDSGIEAARAAAILAAEQYLTMATSVAVHSLTRDDELGKQMNLAPGVRGLERTQSLLKRIHPEAISDLSTHHASQLRDICDQFVKLCTSAMSFSTQEADAPNRRTNLINAMHSIYDEIFERALPAVQLSQRPEDPTIVRARAESLIVATRAKTEELEKQIAERLKSAEEVVAAMRAASAEAVVWKQGTYFKVEADKHASEAATWLRSTKWLLFTLGLLALASIWQHKLPGFHGADAAVWVHVGISKAILFGSIAFFTVLSSRNYLAHRHNEVVNRHRQNSLQTYQALVEAAGDHANRDIVLMKAAESIFGPQSTGYSKLDSEDGKALSMVSVGANLVRPSGPGPS